MILISEGDTNVKASSWNIPLLKNTTTRQQPLLVHRSAGWLRNYDLKSARESLEGSACAALAVDNESVGTVLQNGHREVGVDGDDYLVSRAGVGRAAVNAETDVAVLHGGQILEVAETDVVAADGTLLGGAVDGVVGNHGDAEQAVVGADEHDA